MNIKFVVYLLKSKSIFKPFRKNCKTKIIYNVEKNVSKEEFTIDDLYEILEKVIEHLKKDKNYDLSMVIYFNGICLKPIDTKPRYFSFECFIRDIELWFNVLNRNKKKTIDLHKECFKLRNLVLEYNNITNNTVNNIFNV